VEEEMRARVAWMWSQGDYEPLAEQLAPAAKVLTDACRITPGVSLLDVAAGNGNLALLAAQAGARVTAIDLTPKMVELGRARTEAEGLEVTWLVADATDLDLPDASFDLVASVFGAMFAPDPTAVARELARVLRPGGTLALANYGRAGFLGALSRRIERLGPPSTEPYSPFDWGEPNLVVERLRPWTTDIRVQAHEATFQFSTPEEAWGFTELTNGPLNAMRQLLPAADYAQLAADVRAIIVEVGRAAGSRFVLPWSYLTVLASRLPPG
jgi:SAM-dependent methyltransferase